MVTIMATDAIAVNTIAAIIIIIVFAVINIFKVIFISKRGK